MMNSMIKENGVTFKELEKNIYAWVCQIGREFTKEFLERYDRILMEDRDKKKYRNKGGQADHRENRVRGSNLSENRL